MVVDEVASPIVVAYVEPLGNLLGVTIYNFTRNMYFYVWREGPTGEVAWAYPGDVVRVIVQIKNSGNGDGIIWAKVTDIDTGAEVGYIAKFMVAGGLAQDWLMPDVTMPSKDLNLKVEVGH